MATKRHKPEEIVTTLRRVEVLVGQGMARVDAIREVRISEQTYYRWRKQYGGMGTDQLRELKRLQKENERLRKAVSDLTLDKLILAEAAKGNF
jgi:transposase